MRAILTALALSVSCIAAPASAVTASLTKDAGGAITGATGLSDGSGGVWDLSFADGDCAQLYSGCDADEDFPLDGDAAESVMKGLAALMNETTASDYVSGCAPSSGCNVFLPFEPRDTRRTKYWIALGAPGITWETFSTDILLGDTSRSDFDVFAIATAAAIVPLPAGALLLPSGLVAGAMVRRLSRV
ncbi:MAG: hypothetical protein AAF192_12330 [Pseudomonadota bacterium]